MTDLVQCCVCGDLRQGIDAGRLPEGWDSLSVNRRDGRGLETCIFCMDCTDRARLNLLRADQRRAQARAPSKTGLVAIYQPANRSVLVAIGEVSAELDELEAERISTAIWGALATREHARTLSQVQP